MKRTPLKAKACLKSYTRLKARSPIIRVSKKQKVAQDLWRDITIARAATERHKCQWCGCQGSFYGNNPLCGHHIIKRSKGRVDTADNCYIVHWLCHNFITDHNVDVRQYPNKSSYDAMSAAK